MPENTSLHNYYISNDGKTMLTSADAPGTDYDANLYTLTNLSDGTIVYQFKYYPKEGDYTYPKLSLDGGSMIAVPPTFDDGIVIMDTKGKILHNLTSFNGKKFNNMVVWMPDNTILFSTSDGLFRTNAAFTQGTLVKQFTFADWSDVSASPDGTKIALKGGNHIWMMNADGSNLMQVTTSDEVEAIPVFSPDNKYLVVGTNYRESIAASHLWDLAIIPADGKQYNVNPKADKNVIPVVPKGKTIVLSGDGPMYWR
jgi:WD40 repeat protein